MQDLTPEVLIDGLLDFGSGSDFVDGDAIDEGNRIYLAFGDTVNIYMTWDDWTASNQDYDLYLYNSAGAIVACSTNYQNGTQQPIEGIEYSVTVSGYYEIVIENYDASATPDIELFAFTQSGVGLTATIFVFPSRFASRMDYLIEADRDWLCYGDLNKYAEMVLSEGHEQAGDPRAGSKPMCWIVPRYTMAPVYAFHQGEDIH